MTTLTAKPRPPRADEMPRSTKALVVLRALLALLACVAGCLFASAPAWAVYSRASLPPIAGVSPSEPFSSVDGLAVDASGAASDPCNGDIWVGAYPNVDEFDSAGGFLEQLSGLPENSLAVEGSTCHLYAVGREEYVAVDSSTDVHYVTSVGRQNGSNFGIVQAFNSKDELEPFSGKPAAGEAAYISGNELLGAPCGEAGSEVCYFGRDEPIAGIAVDPDGDIYIAGETDSHARSGDLGGILQRAVIDEFARSGLFIRSFEPEKALPEGLPGSPGANGGFVHLGGVAIDPTNGDLLIEDKTPEQKVIDEFTSAGAFRLQITGPRPGERFEEKPEEGVFGGGIAVSAAGDLYVTDQERHQVDVFGAGAFYPVVVTGAVTAREPGSVTVNGVVGGVENYEDKDLALSECEFEYVSEETFKLEGFADAKTKECAPDLEGQRLKEENYPVHAELENLEAGTVYRYRLLAATAKGEEGGVREGEVESFAAPDLPSVRDVSVGGVSSSWADFHAVIDPAGEDTTYQVQYVSASAYDALAGDPYAAGGVAPVPARGVGAGDAGVSVSVPVGGLSPGTSYDYRVVASNGVGVSDGEDATFATLAVSISGLPDGRSYEMLTPANKLDAEDLFGGKPGLEAQDSGEDETNYDLGYSSEDGEHFLLLSSAALGSFPTSGQDWFVFSRGTNGWSFQAAASPTLGVQSVESAVYDPADFSALGLNDALVAGGGVLLGSSPLVDLLGPPGGPYAEVHAGTNGTASEATIVGGSADLSRVVLEGPDHDLAPTPHDEKQDENSHALYEWTAAEGFRLVNASPQGGLLKCGAILGQSGETTVPEGGTHGAVSADGSRVFFTAPDPYISSGSGCWNGGGANPPQLYVREDGDQTVEVSAPEAGVREGGSNPAEPAVFVGASKDGSKVFS